MTKLLRIATRASRLALWQAEHVRSRLEQLHAGLKVELIPITTTGDRIIDRPLAKIGGKGLFIKELEQALLEGRADIAVHSMKDVPVEVPAAFHIPVILEREDPRDALISSSGEPFSSLQRGARLGTSSLRRKSQILAVRNDFEISDCRGNVPTRIEKLRRGDYDAIILASAGLKRLGMEAEISSRFATELLVPAVGQGAIGIECRRGDEDTQLLITPLHDNESALCVAAERAMSAQLNGGCDIPLAAHAVIHEGELNLCGLVASPDGARIVRDELTGPASEGEALGSALGKKLGAAGAAEILAAIARESA